ncbi:ribonuclease inhibitor isoform X5 [Echinops telfairi]|uniref:Ribonuclease inhibitor isoform X5 n=1 Tax=Echinops telfairi TaxID=9371 RepID=A0AC55D3T1_ECHTE|nr:ribonuclease inhibitor isoform X5 [Echinops telfairi]
MRSLRPAWKLVPALPLRSDLQWSPALALPAGALPWAQLAGGPAPSITMNLDIHGEHVSDTRWMALQPQIKQVEVLRLRLCGLTEARCQELGASLQANPGLQELCVDFNEIGDGGLSLLLQVLLGPTCKIQKLSLPNCSLTASSCEGLADLLRSRPTLLELDLSDNPLGDEGLRMLCGGLQDPQCHLEKLQLEGCQLSGVSCELLEGVLKARPALKELVLSGNQLGPALQGLCQAASNLETLKLVQCGITAADCKGLSSMLAASETLQELHLGENELGSEAMALLCSGMLSPSSRLRVLGLWECCISAEGCRELSRVLGAKESLRELNLTYNELGDTGVALLCEAMREPGCRLESLRMRSCSLTAACCTDLGAMLVQNKHLRELQLSSNNLGDNGVQLLCQGLGQPGTTLRQLCLGDCEVTDRGCASLASLLGANCSLRDLDLSNNCMGEAGLLQLIESIRAPECTLECLVLYDIYFSDKVFQDLTVLEESKPSLKIIS